MSESNGNGRGTTIYRTGMTLIGTAILSVLGYLAITFHDMQLDLEKIKTGYSIQIPSLEKRADQNERAINELMREFYQRGSGNPHQ